MNVTIKKREIKITLNKKVSAIAVCEKMEFKKGEKANGEGKNCFFLGRPEDAG